MSVQMEVWGEYALFTRPEMKTERVSYDVMTPSAARGILEAVYWHPGMKWVIDSIEVLAPIRHTNVRRNEVKSVISARSVKSVMEKGKGSLYINTKDDLQQRAALVLKNVRYVINAHFELTEKASSSDNPGKFQDIIMRRLKKGQCYHQPYFGCREFPAHFRLYEGGCGCPDEMAGERDLGYMLWDMDFSNPENIQPLFFRAYMKDGIISVPVRDSGEVIG